MKSVRLLLATAMAAGTVLLSAGAASAAPPAPAPAPGPAFGAHVSDCAKTMGFSGTHNPSMMRKGMSGMNKAGMDKAGMDMTPTTSAVA